MEQKQEVAPQDYKKGTLRQIILNLAESNPDILVDENLERVYFIEETISTNPISLGSLEYYFENEVDMDVEFQRDSNDHKGDTPEKIISDYCSGSAHQSNS